MAGVPSMIAIFNGSLLISVLKMCRVDHCSYEKNHMLSATRVWEGQKGYTSHQSSITTPWPRSHAAIVICKSAALIPQYVNANMSSLPIAPTKILIDIVRYPRHVKSHLQSDFTKSQAISMLCGLITNWCNNKCELHMNQNTINYQSILSHEYKIFENRYSAQISKLILISRFINSQNREKSHRYEFYLFKDSQVTRYHV